MFRELRKSLKEMLEEIKPFIDRRPKMREYSTTGQWGVSDRVILKIDYPIAGMLLVNFSSSY